MNLTLTKRGDYAVRSAIALGRSYASGTPRKLRQVSADMTVPRTFVSQILGDLVRAGIAVSSYGVNGGYRLTRPPEEISLLEVVEAAEGRLTQSGCVAGDGPCHWQQVCPLHESWTELVGATRELLERTSLAQLADRDGRLEEGSYPVPADAHRVAALTVAVTESVTVALDIEEVAARMQAGSDWLVPHLEAASAAGEALRLRVGPGGPAWLGKTVVVRLGEARSRVDGFVLPITWEATGPSSLFPRFDGSVRVAPGEPVEEGAARSELSVVGRYRPPLGAAGHMLDEALLAHVARATVRTLLRRVATALEAGAPFGAARGRASAGG